MLAAHQIGSSVAILTRLPDGSARVYPSVGLIQFPPQDMVRLFLLPYLVGLAYLAMGVWIYRARGQMRPGRALAFFCVSTAMSCTLLFDLDTTHVGTWIWTVAIAQLGGALVSLAMRFPEEWRFCTRWPWLLAVPYSVSVVLAVWGLWAVNDVLTALGVYRGLGCQLPLYWPGHDRVSGHYGLPGRHGSFAADPAAGPDRSVGQLSGLFALDHLGHRPGF